MSQEGRQTKRLAQCDKLATNTSMPNVLRGNVQTKHSGADKDRHGSQEIFSEKLCLRMNRNELKMKGPSLKQNATPERVRLPGGQSIQKAVVSDMVDARDKNSFKRRDREEAEGRTWYRIHHGIM